MTVDVSYWQVAAWNFVVLAVASVATVLVGVEPAGGGANRPMITGPGLDGPGFYSAPGTCAA